MDSSAHKFFSKISAVIFKIEMKEKIKRDARSDCAPGCRVHSVEILKERLNICDVKLVHCFYTFLPQKVVIVQAFSRKK